MPKYLQLYTPITLLDKSLGEVKKLKPWVLSIILLSLVSSHSFLIHLKMKPKHRLVASSSWILALLSSIFGEINTHSSDSTYIILFRHLEQWDCDMRVDHSLYAQIAWHCSLDPHNWMLLWVKLYAHWLAKGHHFKHILEYVQRDANIIGQSLPTTLQWYVTLALHIMHLAMIVGAVLYPTTAGKFGTLGTSVRFCSQCIKFHSSTGIFCHVFGLARFRGDIRPITFWAVKKGSPWSRLQLIMMQICLTRNSKRSQQKDHTN
jgi:hypothetical protein